MGYGDPEQQQGNPQQGYAPQNPYQQNPYQQPAPYPTYQQPGYQPAYTVQPQPYVNPAQSYQPNYSEATPISNATYGDGSEGYGADDKFPERTSYRDPFFAILFFIHIAVVIALLIYSSRMEDPTNSNINPAPVNGTSSSSSSSSAAAEEFIPFDQLYKVVAICLSTAAAGFFFSVLWLFVMKKFARQLIYFTLIAGIIYSAVIAIAGFLTGNLYVGIIFLIGALFNLLCFYFWRSRIPFATAILETVARILNDFPAPTYVAYISILVHMCWVVLWVPTLSFVQKFEGGAQIAITIFLILSFFWTSQVIKNVVHVTASGLVASWYFLSGLGMPSNPTLKSFKRATTTSFGSICFGSLLVAILKTMRQLVNAARARNGNNLVLCLIACFLSMIESLLQYFNMYAFTQVAIYGKTFVRAAKDTWELIKSHGIDAIINDNLVSGVLLMGALMGGFACALVGGLVARVYLADYWLQFAFVGFLIGLSLVSISMEVVESGVATIFVCFAMDAPALQRNDPILHNKFVETLQGYGARASVV